MTAEHSVAAEAAPMTLWAALSAVPDHRHAAGRRYPLAALLTIALAAMLCGRKPQAAIVRWSKGLSRADLKALGIRERRTPCPSTWCVLFQGLNVTALEQQLAAWVRGDRQRLGHVAGDGKRLRGSRAGEQRGVHLLAAFSDELKGVIGTVKVPHETTALLTLLKQLPLTGRVIMPPSPSGRLPRRSSMAAEIPSWEIPSWWSRITRRWSGGTSPRPSGRSPPSAPFRAVFRPMMDTAETRDRRHGRSELRSELRRLEVTELLPGYIDWPGAAQICRITRERRLKSGISVTVVHAMTSLRRDQADAAALLSLSRRHWGIENHLHFQRDVAFGEDACRIRRGTGPQVLAARRNACLTVFGRAGRRPVDALEAFAENRALALKIVHWRLPRRCRR